MCCKVIIVLKGEAMATHQAVLHRKPQKKSNNNIMIWLFAGGTLMTCAVISVMSVLLLAVFAANQDEVASGVSVAGIRLGGLSYEEAQSALSAQYSSPAVTLMDASRQWQVTYADLGIMFDINATMRDVESADSNTIIQPHYVVDLGTAQNSLVRMSSAINVEALPGNPPQVGRSLEIPVLLDRLRVDALGEVADGVVPLPIMEIDPPELTADNAEDYVGATTTHIVEAGQELSLIAKAYNVSVDDILAMNEIADANLIFVGQNLLIPAAGIYEPTAADAPPAPLSSGRSILVDTNAQRIYAYENGVLVRSHLVSTGRSATPTVKGDYNIYIKLRADDMSGPDYFLPQVPFTMYFYQGYAIHGTYWHSSFGRPMSHGCVNLPVDEAEWFFNFAEVGTLVRVI